MLTTELLALTHSLRCDGPDQCYYCTAPCKRFYAHDQAAFGRRYTEPVLRPGNGYYCVGCSVYRRPRTTVHFLREEGKYAFKDNQTLKEHSWWLDESGAWGIDEQSKIPLWDKILHPPLLFALAFRDGDKAPLNYVQTSWCNDHIDVQADTPLRFTVNNVIYTYTVYEIEEAVRGGTAGKSGGVEVLFRLLGKPPQPAEEKKSKGRPKKEEIGDPRRIVKAALLSGTMGVKC